MIPPRFLAAAPLVLALLACTGVGRESAPAPSAETPEAAAGTGGLGEARSLLEAGDADGALARLSGIEGPDAAVLAADAWGKKAETAPLPTPEPLPAGSPKGAVPVRPEFKPEEVRALELYQKAAGGLDRDPRPHLGMARLLAPHARRQFDRQEEAKRRPPPKAKGRRAAAPPMVTPPPGPDSSPATVLKAYRAAVAASPPSDKAVLEETYAFAVRTGQLDDADWVLLQAVERDKENPEPLVRYGDFLAQVRKTHDAAISQYRQALIWRPDDVAIKEKISEVYLQMGRAHYEQNEWALAESRYLEALKWAPDPTSAQNQRIKAEMEQLKRYRPD